MKKNILVLILVLISSFGVFSQKVRTTSVFDADTTTRPKSGFTGLGFRNGRFFAVPFSGTTYRIINANTHVGTSGQVLSSNGTNNFFKTLGLSDVGVPTLTNGSVLFASSGNISQNNTQFFWDNTNNRLGIGTASPQQKTHINTSLGGVPVGLYLTNDATNSTIGRGVGVLFGGTGNTNLAQIEAQTLTASNNNGGLIFKTANDGTLTERMRIDQNGNVGIGSASLTGISIRNSKAITGATTAYGQLSDGTVQSDVTSQSIGFFNQLNVVAGSFTLPNSYHYFASQGTIGAGSSVTHQHGYYVSSNLIGATNNYGFRGSIPSGTNRYNLYMDGTAENYLAGNLLIGSAAGTNSLIVSKNITGGVDASGIRSSGQIQSDVTSNAFMFRSVANQASYALSTLVGYESTLATISGTGTTFINFRANAAPAVGVYTNVYGFNSTISSASNRWNLYVNGNAQNYLAGPLAIGTNTTAVASAIVEVNSTTQGVLLSRMTTTQINAISSPANGLMVYNTTLNKLCVYENGTWKQVTTTNM